MTLPLPNGQWPADPVQFGRLVRKTRQGRRLSAADLALRAGLNESTVRNIEAGSEASEEARGFLIAALKKP